MRTIIYTYTTKMDIVFDYEFQITFIGSLDKAVNKAESCMDIYGFAHADIIDSDTGEILVQLSDRPCCKSI